ncbi:hypothetical protein GCM10009527_018210 [Actinomadura nitritigenes]|uniref:Uncharacterized protein n=1 Tax=Actinomadura nitritigenes TaxID=134602 RepID=A0ABS3RFM4_9ACTN|nr:hypothetical protein [Actinomadura nitritigenes]MBO2445038.1 hypothetical protein [Actinomadura nitritigenes]
MPDLPSHPETDRHGEPAIAAGSRRRRVLLITAAAAVVALVLVLHLTGVISMGEH